MLMPGVRSEGRGRAGGSLAAESHLCTWALGVGLAVGQEWAREPGFLPASLLPAPPPSPEVLLSPEQGQLALLTFRSTQSHAGSCATGSGKDPGVLCPGMTCGLSATLPRSEQLRPVAGYLLGGCGLQRQPDLERTWLRSCA